MKPIRDVTTALARAAIVGLALLLAAGCGRVEPAPPPEPIATVQPTPAPAGTIVIARGQDFAPFHFTADGVLKGFEIEAIRSAAAAIGREAVFEQYPWSRCLQNAERGTVHAMMNVFRTAEREGFMIYRDDNVLHHEENALWKLRQREDIVYAGDPLALKPQLLGAVQDYSYGPTFDDAAASLRIERSVNEASLLQKLVKRRVDVIVGNTLVLDWLARRAGVREQIEQLTPTISREPLYIAFSRARPGNAELARAFGEALAAFKATGEYRAILRRYGVVPDAGAQH